MVFKTKQYSSWNIIKIIISLYNHGNSFSYKVAQSKILDPYSLRLLKKVLEPSRKWAWARNLLEQKKCLSQALFLRKCKIFSFYLECLPTTKIIRIVTNYFLHKIMNDGKKIVKYTIITQLFYLFEYVLSLSTPSVQYVLSLNMNISYQFTKIRHSHLS